LQKEGCVGGVERLVFYGKAARCVVSMGVFDLKEGKIVVLSPSDGWVYGLSLLLVS